MSAIYVALSGHGFGHAARTGGILKYLKQKRPDLDFHVASRAPAAFFPKSVVIRPVALDVGLVQSDALTIDVRATLAALQERGEDSRLLEEEVRYIKEHDIRLMLADIPPLAARIARAADIPCLMIGNFGWDFVYGSMGPDFAPAARQARADYELAELVFRLPFHEEMKAFRLRMDTPLTGQKSQRDSEELRQYFHRDRFERCILCAFGGLGLSIPLEKAREFPEILFLTFEKSPLPNVRTIPADWPARDLLPLVDAVFTKPGYGMFSDILQAGGRTVYCLERPGFAETELLLMALRQFFRHRLVSQEELLHDWSFLNKRPDLPANALQPVGLNGDEFISNHLERFL
ncbi:MAG: glycosyl transferase [Spirochaetales bacterium]|nr:glycosyl transferase [Spirochaetales bacterium]